MAEETWHGAASGLEPVRSPRLPINLSSIPGIAPVSSLSLLAPGPSVPPLRTSGLPGKHSSKTWPAVDATRLHWVPSLSHWKSLECLELQVPVLSEGESICCIMYFVSSSKLVAMAQPKPYSS